MFLNLLHRFGDIPLPTQRPRHGRRPTALRRPTDRHCWPRLTDRRPTPADWPTGWQVESQAPAEGFLGPSVGPTHRKKKVLKKLLVYTPKNCLYTKKQAPFWCIHPENDYTPKTSTPQTTNFLHFTRCFCLWNQCWCIHPKTDYTPKPKTPVLVYTPQKWLYTRNKVFIYTRNTYTPEKHRKKICGMLGCSEVGEGQGHGCWVSLWSVGLVGSCRQSPMEYLVEPVCLAHGIVLCFVLGHLMCCLFSGPWYISVFSRIGQIPRRDSQGFSLFPTQGLCFRVLYNSC